MKTSVIEVHDMLTVFSAADVEQGSVHPLTQAILRKAGTLVVASPTGFESLDGMGARAETAEGTVLLGNRLLMDTQRLTFGPLDAEVSRLQGEGRTVVHVSLAARVIGLIAIADAIRPTSKAAVAKLRERKIEVVILTGENAATAKRIASDLGIDTVIADGMVGDGVNDAPQSIFPAPLCAGCTIIFGGPWVTTWSRSRSPRALCIRSYSAPKSHA